MSQDNSPPSNAPAYDFFGDHAPAWMRDIHRFFPIRSHFVLSGNIADLVLVPCGEQFVPMSLSRALSAFLEACGYEFLLSYDPFDHFELIAPTAEKIDRVDRAGLGVQFGEDGQMTSKPIKLHEVMKAVVQSPTARGAILIEHAARLGDDDKMELFGASLKLSKRAQHKMMPDGKARYAPVFWLVDSVIGDLPSWFVLKNERVRALTIPRPSIETRHRAAETLAAGMSDYETLSTEERADFVGRFAKETEGFTIDAMLSTEALASDQGHGLRSIQSAVQLYKVGVVENRWEGPALKARIAGAEEELKDYVKGQAAAIKKAVDILVRSVVGLNAAGKPRGVLFLAGPTGVGKTELAKALSRLLFGDAEAYVRFDMSEFSAEHAEARLIGAPPGYVGYGKGGELTKAVSERPQSVILFDEIEKAHPRLFDKFLQVLDDGRLTDGDGRTAYFSESIIVFTSNKGIYTDENGVRTQNVDLSMPRSEYADRIGKEIEKFFKFKLERPELYGRIGDMIVIFDFITRDVAGQIFDRRLDKILAQACEQKRIDIVISDHAREKLRNFAIEDLTNGGRGILSRIEAAFVDPLAAELFKHDPKPGEKIVVSDIGIGDSAFGLVLS